MEKSLLIIDDLEGNRNNLRRLFRPIFAKIVLAENGKDALDKLEEDNFNLIVLDINMPIMNGIEFLEHFHNNKKALPAPVIVCSAQGEIALAIKAMKLGAADYFEKPYSSDVVINRAKSLLDLQRLSEENVQLKTMLKDAKFSSEFARSTPHLAPLHNKLNKLSKINSTVLITGSSGTGKSKFAQEIHQLSGKSTSSFITIDCSSLSSNVIESELFGYVKGAFTGASGNKVGLLEAAKDGTVFIDEIGELPLDLQGRLLHALQERKIRPIGSNEYKEFNGRVIAATNRDLKKDVDDKKFREDLYYRLNIISIKLPNLKEHIKDLPYLVDFFLSKFGENHYIKEDTINQLMTYSWPGNIRELSNKIEAACVLADEELITIEDIFQNENFENDQDTTDPQNEENIPMMTIQEFEKKAIQQAINYTEGNKRKAAELVGIGEATLYRKIKEYDINID